ncbi:MAG: GNAT family N-acetyltransferase [Clostridia bacterium]|nr:GNAT family N-acetyltransferase [Clostridia bacterium]
MEYQPEIPLRNDKLLRCRDGSVGYPSLRLFDDYFTDPKRRAFLLYDCEKLVGFAMVHPYSNTDGSADHVMAEFTIFPAYRRRQLATCAAALFFERFKGRWEVKYNENNTAAKRFWTKVTSGFSPTAKRLNDLETMLSFKTG